MKRKNIKVLLTGLMICTSLTTMGCQMSDLDEEVYDMPGEVIEPEVGTDRKEIEEEEVEEDATDVPEESKKNFNELSKEDKDILESQAYYKLDRWCYNNLGGHIEVKVTGDLPAPDCSMDVYDSRNKMYLGTVGYYYETDGVAVIKSMDPEKENIPMDYYMASDAHCEGCNNQFIGSESGYCGICQRLRYGADYEGEY